MSTFFCHIQFLAYYIVRKYMILDAAIDFETMELGMIKTLWCVPLISYNIFLLSYVKLEKLSFTRRKNNSKHLSEISVRHHPKTHV